MPAPNGYKFVGSYTLKLKLNDSDSVGFDLKINVYKKQ